MKNGKNGIIYIVFVLLITGSINLTNVTAEPGDDFIIQPGVIYDENEIDPIEALSQGYFGEEYVISEPFGDIKDPYYEDGTQKWELSENNEWICQEFTASHDWFSKLGLFLSKSQDAAPAVRLVLIYIREHKDIPWLWCVTKPSALSTTGDWEYWENESTDYPLTPGHNYFIIVNLPVPLTDGHVDWWYGENNPYSDGKCWYSTDGGGSWSYDTDKDFNFQIWGYDNEPPGNPSGFNAYDQTHNSIELSWTKGSDSDKTMIRRSASSYPSSPDSGDPVFFSTESTYIDTGLSSGQRYYYRAWAYNSDTGLYSTGYDQDNEYTRPRDTTSFNAYDPTQTSIKLSWTKGGGSDKTMIRRSASSYPSSPDSGDPVFFSTESSCTDTGLNPRTTYYYSAWGYDSDSGYYSSGYQTDSETTLSPPLKPDLTISNVYIAPEYFRGGDSILIYYTVNNEGDLDSGSFSIKVWLDSEEIGGFFEHNLDAHTSETYFNTITWFDDYIFHEVEIYVDVYEEVDESDENNNGYSGDFRATRPDLIIESVTTDPRWFLPGASVTIHTIVKNIGGSIRENEFWFTEFQFDGERIALTPSAKLSHGKTTEILFSYYWPGDFDQYTIKMIADAEEEILEEDEFNNEREWIRSCSQSTCFLAGTQIAMADGSYKNIEDITVGDNVLSCDRYYCRVSNAQVTKVCHHTPDEMTNYYLIINDDLRVTPNHPLLINDLWKLAEDAVIGDRLLGIDGEYVQIESVEQVYEQVPTYNFEISMSVGTQGVQTYFVQGTLAAIKNDLNILVLKELMQMQGHLSYRQLLLQEGVNQ